MGHFIIFTPEQKQEGDEYVQVTESRLFSLTTKDQLIS
jgi:hypothetical protein